MRARLIGVLLGFGCLIGIVAPSFACAFHDQQASTDARQQTADAQSGTTAAQ